MAGTALLKRDDAMSDGATRAVRVEYNKLVADVEVLRTGLAALAAKFNLAMTALDGDSGVNLTTYNATYAVTVTTYDGAGDMTAALVKDQDGVAT